VADNCARLTANGKTIIAHVITYGDENATYAIDLSPQARTALGLSDSNWTGSWQFSSCPTNGTPIYYAFDGGQWSPQNFWYYAHLDSKPTHSNSFTRDQARQRRVVSGFTAARRRMADGKWR